MSKKQGKKSQPRTYNKYARRNKLFALLALVVVVGMVVAGVVGSFVQATIAGAALNPSSSSSTPGLTGSIPAKGVGLVPEFTLAGTQASYSFALPATPGVTWNSVVLKVAWPLTISSGVVEATDSTQNNQRLSVLRSPSNLDTVETWVIPVSSTSSSPQTITISSQLQFLNTGQQCGPAVSNVSTRLFTESLSYSLNTGGFSVANYLLGPIDKLFLITPATEPKDVVQAGFNVESSVVARDPNRDVAVDFSTQGGTPSLDPFSRTVEFLPDARPGVFIKTHSNGTDYLVIAGTGANLTREISLLVGELFPLVQSQSVQAQQTPLAPHVMSPTLTLSQLGVASTNASGVGYFNLPLGFDQAQAGGELSGASVNFSGSSQVAANGTDVTLTLEAGGSPLYSTKPQGDGTWNITGALPATVVSRTVGLSLVVGYFGGVGVCNDLLPITVSVNPDSTITTTPGQMNGDPGFLEVPQMLLPSARLVIPQWNSTNISSMAQLVAGCQRMTTVPLSLTVSLGDALPSGPSLVVSDTTSQIAKTLTPASIVNKSATFYGPNGITQYSTAPSVSLLTVSHPTPTQSVLALLTPLGAQGVKSTNGMLLALSTQQQWLALTGDAAVWSPGIGIVTAQVSAPLTPTTKQAVTTWLTLPLFVLFLFFVLVALALVVRSLLKKKGESREPTSKV